MAEYIDCELLLLNLGKDGANPKWSGYEGYSYEVHRAMCVTLNEVRKLIKNLPKADVAEVKHGRWKLFSSDKIGNAFICSICGNIEVTENFETTPLDNNCNYCSKCGAKMDKESKQECE